MKRFLKPNTLTLIFGLLALFVALVAWLAPFSPIGRSPFSLPTQTPKPFVNTTFGQAGISPDCGVNQSTTAINQASLIQNGWVYFAMPFEQNDVGKVIYWSIYGPNGSKLMDNKKIEFVTGLNLCLWQGVSIPATSAPGEYFLEIMHEGNVVFKQKFVIENSNLSGLLTADRYAFGNISFGRQGVDRLTCLVDVQVNIISLSEIKENGWIYFASPYTTQEIGKSIIWTITRLDGSVMHSGEKELLEDTLCFWQGFKLSATTPKGDYKVVVEYDATDTYEIVFRVE